MSNLKSWLKKGLYDWYQEHKKQFPGIIALILLGSICAWLLAGVADSFLEKKEISLANVMTGVFVSKTAGKLFLIFEGVIVFGALYLIVFKTSRWKSDLIKVTDKISIPVPAGEYQYGSARFSSLKEVKRRLAVYTVDQNDAYISKLLKHGEDIYRAAEGYSDRAHAGSDFSDILDAPEPPEDFGMEMQPFRKDNDKKTSKKYAGVPDYAGIPDDTTVVLAETKHSATDTPYFPKGGLVCGMEKHGNTEHWLVDTDDTHSLVVGMPGSGKSRKIVIQSIMAMAFANEGIVITDPKGELYQYTSALLKAMGYAVCCLDFRNPQKSSKYNLLQPVIDAFNEGRREAAEMAAWDLTNIMVPESTHGEKMWENGEKAVIVASILSVVWENCVRGHKKNESHPEFQNLTNVYWFLNEMAIEFGYIDKDSVSDKNPEGTERSTNGFEEYAAKLPDDHPAKALFGIANIAPGRTKGSFFTSALITLRLFTTLSMWQLTSKTDIDISDVGLDNKNGADCKTALFVILPDERTTYYPIATLVISQLYELLTRMAESSGGRLKRRVHFVLDEFGNFSKLEGYTNKLTVARSRGMRFHMFLQDLEQLDKTYEEKSASIIKSSCDNWIYLKTAEQKTLKEFSEKLGTYTCNSFSTSASSSVAGSGAGSVSHSGQLISRHLLMPDEVKLIADPYLLMIKDTIAAILESPDLSNWALNTALGLGDRNHNEKVRKMAEDSRPEEILSTTSIPMWGIWREIQASLGAITGKKSHNR